MAMRVLLEDIELIGLDLVSDLGFGVSGLGFRPGSLCPFIGFMV